MADDHALWGHSAGGAFTGYALLARPGAFGRFIVGSGTNGLTIDLEAEYAKDHDDLEARVFIDLYTRLYTGRDHFTVMPLIIGDGLQHVYADLVAGLEKPNW